MNFRSKGEEKLYNDYLLRYLIPEIEIIHEAKLKLYGCSRNLSIDFLLCNKYNEPLVGIEVQGLQHYQDEKVIERDNFKRQWCHNNFISYITVDWDCKKLDFTDWAQEWKDEWAEQCFIDFLKDINEYNNIKCPSIEERRKNREDAAKRMGDEMRQLISQLLKG